LLGWTGKGELVTLTQAEASAAPLRLQGAHLYSALYMNELVLKLCPRSDPHEGLFAHDALGLNRLASGEPESWSLRRFERDLLSILGYAMVLDRDGETGAALEADVDYAYVIDSGPRAWRGTNSELRISGAALLALAQDELPTPRQRGELRRLMRTVIEHQLGGGTLRAWALHATPGTPQ
jgi:DNA repair protein RecO (recombination protein O)